MYNAVGIDASKEKSTVAVLQPGGTVTRKPFNVSHTSQSLHSQNLLSGWNSDFHIFTVLPVEFSPTY